MKLPIEMNMAKDPKPTGVPLESGSSTGLSIYSRKSLNLELTTEPRDDRQAILRGEEEIPF
jgi:hypothetical protein